MSDESQKSQDNKDIKEKVEPQVSKEKVDQEEDQLPKVSNESQKLQDSKDTEEDFVEI